MKEGDEYKNYKELCKELKEPEKSGRGKELQLKRWGESFQFHKEGQKIIIDEIKDIRIREPSGGNNKHVEVFLPYVIYCLYRSGIDDEYIGTQRLLQSELKLIPNEVYKVFNQRTRDHTDYLRKNSISLYESLTCFVHYFEVNVKETFERCLNVLEKGDALHWSPGYVFIVGMFHKRGIYVTGFEDTIKKVEENLCIEMNKDRTDLKGRQYLHVIKRDKELTKVFYKKSISVLMKDKKLMKAIRTKYKKEYGAGFEPEMIQSYHAVYYIENIDRKQLRKWKISSPINSLRMKKAFVNPDGPEIQTLKEKVYKDVFQRMNKKKRYGIPAGEFESMTFLIQDHRQKLFKKNYSPKEIESQEGSEDGNIRAEN